MQWFRKNKYSTIMKQICLKTITSISSWNYIHGISISSCHAYDNALSDTSTANN